MLPILNTKFYAVPAVDVGYGHPEDPVQGVVYTPGFICMKSNTAFYTGVVVKDESGLALWATYGNDLPDNSGWDSFIHERVGLFSQADENLCNKLQKDQVAYFRSLNLYRRILPENKMVQDLWGIFTDGGTLTFSQRGMVDKLFAGSDYKGVYFAFSVMNGLDILSSLGNQSGLDQHTVQKMIVAVKNEGLNVQAEDFMFEKLNEFQHLVRPLSERLVTKWPPRGHVLSLW